MAATARFVDMFDRADGEIGDNYTVVCGDVELLDETIWPVEVIPTTSPDIISNSSRQKVQALVTGSTMDGANYAARAVFSHLKELPGIQPISQLLIQANLDPSFTILARMTKDPLILDLERSRIGGSARSYEFDPECYDQGYGLRVTCHRNGSAPILKIIKFAPPVIGPGVSGPQTLTEVDKARVLASFTLTANHLQCETAGDVTTYRGLVQVIRFRIRRADDQVILEAYINDRNQNVPVLTFTDRQNPLWGVIGLSGFEFLQATLVTQPVGTSPWSLRGIPLMACHKFEVETIKDFASPSVTTPENFYTYTRVAQRVALLAEKDGDTIFTATPKTNARLAVYLDFVRECEQEILRKEGYWKFLERTGSFFLVGNQAEYELPENVSMIYGFQRLTSPTRPLPTVLQKEFREFVPNPAQTGSIPQITVVYGEGPNNRPLVRLANTPSSDADGVEIVFDYYARWINPSEPDREIPLIPQEDMDVLIYGAASHAGPFATASQKVVQWEALYQKKLQDMVRRNNRKMNRRTIMRHVLDTPDPSLTSLFPLTRAAQLSQNFFLR
jgi:hypothetical protein